MASFRVLLLKDSRPGHFRKSDGVAMALSRRHAVALSEVSIRTILPLPARVQRMLIGTPLPAPLIARMWSIRLNELERPHLIVSSGAETLAPNVRLARLFGSQNVFIGSVRGLAPHLFTAVLTARPDLGGRERHHVVLSPSPVDPDRLRQPQPIASAADLAGRKLALLLGGPTSQYRFTDADWDALHRLIALTAEIGVDWDVTSSRRTPDAVTDDFALLASSLPERVRFIDYRRQSVGSIDPLFNADAILVTEDSNTMLSEAVAARRPVVALRPDHAAKVAPSIAPLIEDNLVGILAMHQATSDRLVGTIGQLHPLQENHLDTLCRVLRSAGVPRIDSLNG